MAWLCPDVKLTPGCWPALCWASGAAPWQILAFLLHLKHWQGLGSENSSCVGTGRWVTSLLLKDQPQEPTPRATGHPAGSIAPNRLSRRDVQGKERGEGQEVALEEHNEAQPSTDPLPLFLRLRGKADLLCGCVILLAR